MEKAGILKVTIMAGQAPKNANKSQSQVSSPSSPPFQISPTVTLETSLKIMIKRLNTFWRLESLSSFPLMTERLLFGPLYFTVQIKHLIQLALFYADGSDFSSNS